MLSLTVSYLLFLSQSLSIKQMTSSCKCGTEGPLIQDWGCISWISVLLWQQKIKSIHPTHLELLPLRETKLKWPPCTSLCVANVGRISWSRFPCCCLALVYCLVYFIYLSGTTNSIADFEQLACLGPDPDAIHSQGFIFFRDELSRLLPVSGLLNQKPAKAHYPSPGKW